jgi:hypothetical protein
MKKSVFFWGPLALAVLLLVVTGVASATTLDFDAGVPSGMTLGGNMTWNSTGGGHLYCEGYLSDDYIYFTNPTSVNSFQMNAWPWQDYGSGDGRMDIAAFDSGNVQLWSTTVDLTGYTDWATWLTVNVGTANVSSLTFYSPYNTHGDGFWPSIDNMVINEAAVPIPPTVMLLGSGLLGLVGLRRLRQSS